LQVNQSGEQQKQKRQFNKFVLGWILVIPLADGLQLEFWQMMYMGALPEFSWINIASDC